VRESIDFLGIEVDVLDTQGIYKRIMDFVREGTPHKAYYLNAHCTNIAHADGAYRDVLNRADLVYADGLSIVMGARLLGKRLPGRSTGADFLPKFCRGFADNHLRVFFLGAAPGIAEKAAARLKEDIPSLEIVGTQHGFFDQEETEAVVGRIRQAKPHIVIVGMGVPYQEMWIDENAEALGVPVVWGVGALFDFISGELRRGPKFLVDHGFEWLCRLCIEPGRLWRRYLLGNLNFVRHVLAYRFSRKGASSP
jgi:N-acetylglucosaminyldiphosphoundecaprenol N-acetyl-beta-D-mannosaminyltransferase